MMTQNNGSGLVEIGIQRLLAKYPLFGGLVATWTVIEDAGISTMAIGLGSSGFNLYYNSDFVRKLKIDQLVGVLHHEARHVVYGHVFLDPTLYLDKNALTIAEEVTVNERLPEPLPGNPIRLSQYPTLKPNQDTETRYHRLAKKKKHHSQTADKGGAGKPLNNPKGTGNVAIPGVDATPTSDRSGLLSNSKTAGSGTAATSASVISRPQHNTPTTLDDHSRWREVREQESFAKAILDGSIRDIIEKNPNLSPLERKAVDVAIRQQGDVPDNFVSVIQQVPGRAKLNWRVLLRRYTGQELSRTQTLGKPPRRFPQMVGILPANAHTAEKPKIMAVVDTSLSMSDAMLADIVKELHFLARDYYVWIVECDAAVQRVYRLNTRIKLVQGRGGTDFRPPLKPRFIRQHRPDLVMFFTDGRGPAPARPPQVPVVWVLTPGWESPVPWGRVIKMPESPKK